MDDSNVPDLFNEIFKKKNQIKRMIECLGFDFPNRTLEIPFWKKEYKTVFDWSERNEKKMVQKAIGFLYFLKGKTNITTLEDENMCLHMMKFYEFFLKTMKQENEKNIDLEQWTFLCPRSIFPFNYYLKSFLLRTELVDIKKLKGYASLDVMLKKIQRFAGRSCSVEPYPNDFILNVFETYPEEGENLVEKLVFLCRAPSPVRGSHLRKCSFDNFTHNLELQTIMFHSNEGKTGLTYLYITHYKKAILYSVYRIMTKYLVKVKKREGSFFKHWNEETQCYDKDFSKNDYVHIRKNFECRYLHLFPADVFMEELIGRPLPPSLRYCNINISGGLRRFGDKSWRKTYATNGRSNSELTDEQMSREYWDSLGTFINSYQVGQSEAQIDRQEKVMNHMINLRNVLKSDLSSSSFFPPTNSLPSAVPQMNALSSSLLNNNKNEVIEQTVTSSSSLSNDNDLLPQKHISKEEENPLISSFNAIPNVNNSMFRKSDVSIVKRRRKEERYERECQNFPNPKRFNFHILPKFGNQNVEELKNQAEEAYNILFLLNSKNNEQIDVETEEIDFDFSKIE